MFGGRGLSTTLGDADLVVASGNIGGFCICSESCCVLGCDAASDGGDLVPRLQVLKLLVRTGLAISRRISLGFGCIRGSLAKFGGQISWLIGFVVRQLVVGVVPARAVAAVMVGQ